VPVALRATDTNTSGQETLMRQALLFAALVAVAAIVIGSSVGGCSSPAAKNESQRSTIASQASAAMDAFNNEDPSLKELLDKSVGYAIFPDVGKAGFIAGGSYGKGEVFEGGKKIGYADITQATFGLQAGAQTFDELILFLKPDELTSFKQGEFKFAGNVSAVAIKAGAAKTADTSKGVVVFVRANGGLMAEASVGGQRFRYEPAPTSGATTRPVQ
jgi:lipid-binding SYLF domain-containing protein